MIIYQFLDVRFVRIRPVSNIEFSMHRIQFTFRFDHNNSAACRTKTQWFSAFNAINVQYRQSESDGESHQTSFTMDPMEFFHTGHVTNIHIHYIT